MRRAWGTGRMRADRGAVQACLHACHAHPAQPPAHRPAHGEQEGGRRARLAGSSERQARHGSQCWVAGMRRHARAHGRGGGALAPAGALCARARRAGRGRPALAHARAAAGAAAGRPKSPQAPLRRAAAAAAGARGRRGASAARPCRRMRRSGGCRTSYYCPWLGQLACVQGQ